MGWHIYCVFVTQREPGYLATFPQHDPAKADRLLQALGLQGYQRGGPTTLEDSLAMDDGTISIGAYEDGAIIGSPEISGRLIETDSGPDLQALLSVYPGARVLSVNVEDSCNSYLFSYFEGAIRLRRFEAHAEAGPGLVESGPPLPEEAPLFRERRSKGGQVQFRFPDSDDDEDEWKEPWYVGAEALFEVTSRVFGVRMDNFDFEEIAMERFESPRPPAPPPAERKPRRATSIAVKSKVRPAPKGGFFRRLFGG